MNPFNMFNNPNGPLGPINPNNPFAWNALSFEIKAVHDSTGSVREGIMTINLPSQATEQQARRMILDMAYECKWHLRKLRRINAPEETENAY